jgi:hypothetical protein
MSQLILKKTASHYGQPWGDDDYVVLDAGKIIGRVLWTHAASRDTPWFWSIIKDGPQMPH